MEGVLRSQEIPEIREKTGTVISDRRGGSPFAAYKESAASPGQEAVASEGRGAVCGIRSPFAGNKKNSASSCRESAVSEDRGTVSTEWLETAAGAEMLPEALCYNTGHPILFFPIRHHSPCCAFHLKKAVAEYRPDCILIEGPETAGDLIPVLTHEDTKAPLALYYAYRDKGGLVSPDREEYKCYYPFLDCSPELVALREAAAWKIPAFFIDLPYYEILIGTSGHYGAAGEGEKQTYNDDYLLGRSRYLKGLCEKTGLRNFEEFWEKYFEIQGLGEETAVFVRQMLTYCMLSRQHETQQELEEDGCLLRERYMAEQIRKYSADYQKILVVTGGFHTYGLWELLTGKGKKGSTDRILRLHPAAGTNQEIYPIAYSMEAADALNGYASGMQSPGFYHQVWTRLEEQKRSEGVYQDTVLHYLAATGKEARKQGEGVSSYDEICAYTMAGGLAALRGKREPGLYELRDAALSSFVKGEYNMSTDGALGVLNELVTGRQVGRLCAEARRPPILEDFEAQCRLYGLRFRSLTKTEVTLEIFAKEKHLQMSRFFYQLEFLDCGFAGRDKGIDLIGRRDRNRIREIWSYKWSAKVTAVLIDVSISGGTVEEVAYSLFYKKLGKSTGCREAAELLVRGFLMGLQEEQDWMQDHLGRVLASDGDFFSLARGFSHLLMLEELQDLYRARQHMELGGMIRQCFRKLLQLLPSMGNVGEEQQQECMECLRILYQASGKKGCQELRPFLIEALEAMVSRERLSVSGKQIRPGIEGTVLGLLYGYDGDYGAWIHQAARGYLQGTADMLKKSADFLRGLFFTARDFVFVSRDFLQMVDGLLGLLSTEDFLKLLPELRRAFVYFTPMEVDRIARQAAAFHGEKEIRMGNAAEMDPELSAYGERINAYAEERMKGEWL